MASLAPASPATVRSIPTARPRAVANWLFAVSALVFVMVVVGGITRLTESGLSIVRWDVVTGTLPPLSDAAWQAEFKAYKASSQYKLMNHGMSLAAFKGIFFWEYLHRLLGRLIGLAFALPLAWFWLKGRIPAGYKPRLLALLALGGLQGAIGWWMVSSGLVGRTEVAHTRLAVHLTTALAIMAGCIWTALDLRATSRPAFGMGTRSRLLIPAFVALLSVQIIWGAFTAGLRAGHASDTWPLMAGALVPAGLSASLAGWVDDPFTVHFLHRSLAVLVLGGALIFTRHLWAIGASGPAQALAAAVTAQFVLGVLTVLSGVALPLGVAHQACAALLVAATTWGAHHALRRP
ncbi:COX15/CtaA family protein [Polymorphobacter sp.]|uniref:COX15/CtaA family protein n=1 Tax=Polymorphobacter sp. TaxID=1909290 RepID=UPI003F72D404